MAKVIIESAINGFAPRSLNPNIPLSPEEIANDMVATVEAGAASIHFHVREPETGEWSHRVDYYRESYRRARAMGCKAILWPTFALDGTPEERLRHYIELAKDPVTKPDCGAADMGSINLVSYDPVKRRMKEEEGVYCNSYATLRRFLEICREIKLGRPTLQIFDPSFARAALYFLDQGLLTEPLLLKIHCGGPYAPLGLPPSLKSLEAYLQMFKGVRINWFGGCFGGDNLPMIPAIVSLGGHVRVGLEDYQYPNEGQLRNPQIVERAVATIKGMGHEVATSGEARKMLEL